MHAYSWVDISADWKSCCCGCTWSRPCTRTAPEFWSVLDTKNRCIHTQISPCTFREHRTSELCLDTECEHSQRFNLFSQSNSAADPGEGPRGPGPPFCQTKLRPKGPKKMFWRLPPYISQGLDAPPPLISRSGCGTEIGPVVTMSLHCVGTFLAALLITPAFLAIIRDCMLPTLVMVVSQSETDKSQR